MKWFILILSLSVLACQKKSDPETGVAPTQPVVTGYTAPSGCSATTSGAHDFLEWPVMSAQSYDCPVATGQTCTLSISDDQVHAELICSGAGARPSSCAIVSSSGHHEFLDGQFLADDAYDCGVWNNLRCYRFEAASETEMRCLDNELPYYTPVTFAN